MIYMKGKDEDDWVPLGEFDDIPEFTGNPSSEQSIKTFSFIEPMEFCCEMFVSRRTRRKLDNMILYRWLAKGPVRKKALDKAWGLKGGRTYVH